MNVECKCVCHVAGNQQHSDCCAITHLKARVAALSDIAMQTKAQWDAQIAMTVARLGGTVEGAPTHAGNFLQRIDALREIERAAMSLVTRDDFWRNAGTLPGEYDNLRDALGMKGEP
jgi:hypothetical protein